MGDSLVSGYNITDRRVEIWVTALCLSTASLTGGWRYG